ERLLPLVLSGQRGTVHLAGPEPLSIHELLVRARRAGALAGEVEEQKAGDLALAAARPANSALTSLVLDPASVPPMPPLDRALSELTEVVRG
ncbi:MAG: hypothetical protein M3245_03275, partial [Actinomycetota bacterium]|nr:hypothetical protein [Actinomycetota bacterium]